ncbi:hypothetical protein BC941DRAFT_415113, partial [Chlamydoabsidia padenii]
MTRYESLAGFFGYTPVEMVEELQDVLEGEAFSWYTRLQRTIKKDWVALIMKTQILLWRLLSNSSLSSKI